MSPHVAPVLAGKLGLNKPCSWLTNCFVLSLEAHVSLGDE